jgi:hypothetical protein
VGKTKRGKGTKFMVSEEPQETQNPGWTSLAPLQTALEGGAVVRLAGQLPPFGGTL